jgi:hypothetical protein
VAAGVAAAGVVAAGVVAAWVVVVAWAAAAWVVVVAWAAEWPGVAAWGVEWVAEAWAAEAWVVEWPAGAEWPAAVVEWAAGVEWVAAAVWPAEAVWPAAVEWVAGVEWEAVWAVAVAPRRNTEAIAQCASHRLDRRTKRAARPSGLPAQTLPARIEHAARMKLALGELGERNQRPMGRDRDPAFEDRRIAPAQQHRLPAREARGVRAAD